MPTPFWRLPWSPSAAAAATAVTVMPCAAVQILHPGLMVALPAPPWGALTIALPLLLLIVYQAWRPQSPVLASLGGIPLAIASLAAAGLIAAPTAIWPTGTTAPSFLLRLGLADSTTSLPFAAAYALLLANLTVSGARYALTRRSSAWTVVFVHAGLVVALGAAASGLGNTVRARVWLEEGAPAATRAFRIDDGRPVPLPRPIALRDFQLETWEASLAAGEQAAGTWRYRPGRLALRPGTEEHLGPWLVHIDEVLPQVAIVDGQPRPFPQPGAGPAARVRVMDVSGAVLASGWVHPPTAHGPPLILPVGNTGAVLIPPLKPRLFRSLLRLGDQDTELEVNRPLMVDGWWLYQTGYDEERGGASTRSQLEAVHDPALPGIYAGVGLLAIGLLLHLGRLRRQLTQAGAGASP